MKIPAKKEKSISYYFQTVARTWNMPKAPKSDASVLFYSLPSSNYCTTFNYEDVDKLDGLMLRVFASFPHLFL